MRIERNQYIKKLQFFKYLKSKFKSFKQRRSYLLLKTICIVIQKLFRGKRLRRYTLNLNIKY